MREFEEMLDDVLEEMTRVEPPAGFAARMKAAGVVQGMEREREDAMTGVLLTGGVAEVGVLGSLWESVRDAVVRRRLAPLVLESRPVPVVDRMAVRRGFGPVGWAVAAHAVVIVLIGLAVVEGKVRLAAPPVTTVALVEAPAPMKLAPKSEAAGGGGGQKSPTPAAKGSLPKFAEVQIVPPKATPVFPPKLAVDSTVVVPDLKMANNTMPNLGMPNSPIVGTGSLGGGAGNGIGGGNGDGVGPGWGKGMGGALYRVGGGVSAPVPISMPDPEFSEEARKSKTSGNVVVYLWVDPQGRPSHVRVARGIGMGLDEKAVAAVKQYTFKPAMKDGKPVTVEMQVEVNFTIF